ncbi:MAG TPA: 16S rRNA (cytosine(1402)-N(4))-methyltransferase RsmH [Candidatus Krumholzibacteria bacterium]|nr:16S rRNA (cytosine(1402)-N(4))-methyltransferase RsmH [Candidatus Krumholzibacteria bacterium]
MAGERGRPAESGARGSTAHVPVLCDDVVAFVAQGPGEQVLDGTVGYGGHAEAILAALPQARLVGLDVDPEALQAAAQRLQRFGDRVQLLHGNYAGMDACLAELGIDTVSAIVLDLGVSSAQIDTASRGFSYRQPGPLDMRMDPTAARTAAELLHTAPMEEIARVLREYGEERSARRIARAVVEARLRAPLVTTTDLAALVRSGSGRKPVSTLARVFQGVRVWVNGELENLRQGLGRSLGVLAPGSILAVLSYHSLEDRLVKQFFRRQEEGCICPPDLPRCGCGFVPGFRVLTRRAVRPGTAEVARNVRARSARLRVLQRLP